MRKKHLSKFCHFSPYLVQDIDNNLCLQKNKNLFQSILWESNNISQYHQLLVIYIKK